MTLPAVLDRLLVRAGVLRPKAEVIDLSAVFLAKRIRHEHARWTRQLDNPPPFPGIQPEKPWPRR